MEVKKKLKAIEKIVAKREPLEMVNTTAREVLRVLQRHPHYEARQMDVHGHLSAYSRFSVEELEDWINNHTNGFRNRNCIICAYMSDRNVPCIDDVSYVFYY